MKKLLFLAALIGSLGAMAADGSVLYVNKSAVAPGVDAPIWLDAVTTGTKLAGANYSAQLMMGADASSLAAVAGSVVPFRTGTGAGYWNPGASTTLTIAGSVGGNTTTLAIRAWDNGGTGLTFDQALAAGKATGVSDPFSYVLGGGGSPPATPGAMGGLKSFAITAAAIPEPTTLALGALGIAALLLRRRQ